MADKTYRLKSTPGRGRLTPSGRLPTREKSFGTSVILVLPLLLIYQIGILASNFRNGVDFVTRGMFYLVHYDRHSYLVLNLAITAVFVALVFFLAKRQKFELKQFLPTIAESAVYALLMGSFILFVMSRVLHMTPRLVVGGVYDEVIMSVGAGVHEEIVFRLGLMVGLTYLLERAAKLKFGVALAVAFLVSSAVFSYAHHIGPFGEPFRAGVFTYRMLAGLVFATIFYFRSFATAVYAHAFYDIYVTLIRS